MLIFNMVGGSTSTNETIKEKDVNFYDYDGTLVASYTLDEAKSLTKLPESPNHFSNTWPPLNFQEWNWSLEDINNVDEHGANVAAIFTTNNGSTYARVKLVNEYDLDLRLTFTQSVSDGVSVFWGDTNGDGRDITISGTGMVTATYSYSEPGEYLITLTPDDNCEVELGYESCGFITRTDESNTLYAVCLEDLYIGKNVTGMGWNALYGSPIKTITIPNTVTIPSSTLFRCFRSCASLRFLPLPKNCIPSYFNGLCSIKAVSLPKLTEDVTLYFNDCYGLNNIKLSDKVSAHMQNCYSLEFIKYSGKLLDTNIDGASFTFCRNLRSIDLTDSKTTSITGGCFNDCENLTSIKIPATVTQIKTNAFYACSNMRCYDFSDHTAIPALSSSGSISCSSLTEIRVPAALYDEWIVATNWVTHADYIVAV